MQYWKSHVTLGAYAALIMMLASCASQPWSQACGSGAGSVLDEAKCAGRTAESLPAADEDYFRDMDYGFTKDSKAVAAELDKYLSGITPEQATEAVVKGPQQLDRLDRGQRPAVGRALGQERRDAGFPQDPVRPSQPRLQP